MASADNKSFVDACAACFSIASVYSATFLLNGLLPGQTVPGYVLDGAGKRSVYVLNGLRVLVVTVAGAALAVREGLFPADFFYTHFVECATAACVAGLTFSLFMHLRGLRLVAAGRIERGDRCATVDQPGAAPSSVPSYFDRRSVLAHFYCGLSEFNPRMWPALDVKMWLYVVGAVQLQLNVLSAVAAHVAVRAEGGTLTSGIPLGSLGSVSYAVAVYAFCFTFFIVEYMAHEHVHLLTYDIFRERIGFKLAWGCLCFYPFFYSVGVLPLVHAKADVTPGQALLCLSLFFSGWALTRGANLQKFYFKQGAKTFLWGYMRMESVPGSNDRLLCSGFWALSRHINYAGEVLQAVGLALPCALATGSPLPWLYPAYYVALFLPRQVDDDAMCAAKYGRVWEEYVRRVPYRIVPGLY